MKPSWDKSHKNCLSCRNLGHKCIKLRSRFGLTEDKNFSLARNFFHRKTSLEGTVGRNHLLCHKGRCRHTQYRSIFRWLHTAPEQAGKSLSESPKHNLRHKLYLASMSIQSSTVQLGTGHMSFLLLGSNPDRNSRTLRWKCWMLGKSDWNFAQCIFEELN